MAVQCPHASSSWNNGSVLQTRRLPRFVKLAWASPCTFVGLVFGFAILLCGGLISRSANTLEITLHGSHPPGRAPLRWLPFRAITLGHVIIAISRQELVLLRAHERIHVRQYERWGIIFFAAYLASSCWQILKGGHPYWDNFFEVEARLLSAQTQEKEI